DMDDFGLGDFDDGR
nr:RecName: Full=Uncharacterized protein IMPP20 [Nautilus macromphalus]